MIIGQDGRTSTSKTFVLMWTLLVGWALVSMLIVGELITIHGCAGSLATPDQVAGAIKACQNVNDQVGLLQIGWHNFTQNGLTGGYLILLGIPASAAVAAKAITQSKDDSGTAPKTVAAVDQNATVTTKAAARVAQIFSADDGTTDIGDFQYVIFNLVTAVYFVAEFVRPSVLGLPVIPDTLLGLTSVSAALYVGKKAVTRTQPTITGVFPSNLRVGAQAVITGSGLTADPAAPPPAGAVARVTFNGIDSTDVQPDPVAGSLRATVPAGAVPAGAVPAGAVPAGAVPAGAVPAGGPDSISATVQVRNAYGAVTTGFTVQLSR